MKCRQAKGKLLLIKCKLFHSEFSFYLANINTLDNNNNSNKKNCNCIIYVELYCIIFAQLHFYQSTYSGIGNFLKLDQESLISVTHFNTTSISLPPPQHALNYDNTESIFPRNHAV